MQSGSKRAKATTTPAPPASAPAAPIPGAPAAAAPKKGRQVGIKNWSDEMKSTGLGFIQEGLPFGANHWIKRVNGYNEVAEAEGWPIRTADSLKMMFDRVCIVFVLRLLPHADFPPALQDQAADWWCRGS